MSETQEERSTEDEAFEAERGRPLAAFFDFGGLFFQLTSGWKVRNPRLGVVGSRLGNEEAYAIFQRVRADDSNALVTDHFALDEFELSAAESMDGNANVAPITSLLHYARHHLYGRAQLYTVVPPGFEELARRLTDVVFERLDNFMMFENPMGRARPVYPDAQTMVGDYMDRTLAKVIFYRSFLESAPEHESSGESPYARFNPDGRTYEQVYVYHTEPHLETALREMLRRDATALAGGRNAVVPLCITAGGEAGTDHTGVATE